MPHWIVFHPPGTFEDEATKGALAKTITSYYTRDGVGMPAFYVVVNFIKTDPSDQWLGGELATSRSSKPFIRIRVTHIHINVADDPKIHAAMVGRLSELLKPHTLDKGYDLEYEIAESKRSLWHINGMNPPEFKSEDEKVWRAENRAVPPEEMEEARRKIGNVNGS
ncbi:hypothetical protein DOTSEDRAFT_181504 [Dothistroma septosporum NZE10]|uniref:Tautomerase cis-CaaD-like domain-containing protein n=1 Tax=Dothistroma septosporum (strain NZE10 / CBS 128990) TaxID=675120 RepID=N1PBI6_DOTSN|nr:hypothetical protein DOTSEDRAFT_181504 [Dothistroma septosporum NZE10]